jgi:hypothetical protein
MPHLLAWYAAYCVTIAETCTHAGTNRLLRLLAVDLIIEARKYRDLINRVGLTKTQSGQPELLSEECSEANLPALDLF